MKRASYLARLADGVKGQPSLQPPPVIFRPSAADASGFVESSNESSPARTAAAQMSPDTAGAHRAAAHGFEVRPASPRRFGDSSAAPGTAAGPRQSSVSLSPARVARESHSSVPTMHRIGPMHASVSPAAPLPAENSASRTPPRLTPPEHPEPRRDARSREIAAAPTTLIPPMPGERVAASSRSSDRKKSGPESGVSVQIGTLEVRISPPPAPAPPKPAGLQRPATQPRKESLSRGFGSFGMVQG